MAGGKRATQQEKEQIRELLKAGETVEEVCKRFPHVNGQVISGVAARLRQFGPPESSGEANSIPKPSLPESPTSAPAVVRPPDKPEQIVADNLGFSKTAETISTPTGMKPAYREFFVIKKLDQPNAGIIRKEYPPFSIAEFLERYDAGEYEIEHYRDGKLYQTYREAISPRAKDSQFQRAQAADDRNKIVRQESTRTDSPVDSFFRALDFANRMHNERGHENASVRAAEVAVKSEEVKAKAQLETVQTSGLLEILREERSKPHPKDNSVSELLTVMREEREAARERHKQELEAADARHKRDLELERERRKAEADAAKLEAENKIAREREYMQGLKALDDARQALWKEGYDNMMEQAKGLKESISDELDKRREQDARMSEMMLNHTKEVIDLKKAAGSSEKDIEMAKIISNGISGGLDRIGSRVDMLVNAGVIGEGGGGKPIPRKVKSPLGENGGTPTADAANSPKTTEAVKTVTKEMIKEQIKEPWFQDLQREISLTIKKRMAATTPAGKPHGSMLGQTLLDRMNSDLRIRTYFHFLCTRQWDDLLTEIEEGLTEENKTLFREKEAALWFDEFQSFLILAWNNTILEQQNGK